MTDFLKMLCTKTFQLNVAPDLRIFELHISEHYFPSGQSGPHKVCFDK